MQNLDVCKSGRLWVGLQQTVITNVVSMKRWSRSASGNQYRLYGHDTSVFRIKIRDCSCISAVCRVKSRKLNSLILDKDGEAGLSIVFQLAAGQFVDVELLVFPHNCQEKSHCRPLIIFLLVSCRVYLRKLVITDLVLFMEHFELVYDVE